MLSFFKRKNPNQTMEITVSNGTIIKVLVLTLLSLLFLAALQKASHALILIFTAFLLTLALNTPVQWLASHIPGKRRGSRKIGTALSFLLITVLLVGFLASIVPPLVKQTNNFLNAAPGLVEDARDDNSSLGNFIRRNNLEGQVEKLSGEISDKVNNVSGNAVSTFTRITSSIFSSLAVLVLTIMMLLEGPKWIGLIIKLVPKEKKKHVQKLGNDMYNVIKGFVNGQVTLAALAAAVMLVPLLLLDVGYPIAMVVIVFIAGLIPMVGHYVGATVVTLVALFTSVFSAIGILAFYILYQQAENYILQPKIQANATNMSPLLVFSAVLIGVNFGGLFGGLVAIPIAGCLRILILDYMFRVNILDNTDTEKTTN